MAAVKKDRFADLRSSVTAIVFDAKDKPGQRRATEEKITQLLKRRFPADKNVSSVNDLVAVISAIYEGVAATYATLPTNFKFIVNAAVADAIVEWLPEETLFARTVKRSMRMLVIAVDGLALTGAFTKDNVQTTISPILNTNYNEEAGGGSPEGEDMDTEPPHGGGKTPPHGASTEKPVPSFIDALALIDAPQRGVYSRLAGLAQEEQRPGVDKYSIIGIAAELRKATVEAVRHNSTGAMNTLIAFWGGDELERLGDVFKTTHESFLTNQKVLVLIGDLINDHYGRHGSPIPVAVIDRFDAFFNGAGVPEALRGPLKKLLSPGGIETMVDDVENVVYPSVLAGFRGTYSAPVGFMSLLLLILAIAQAWWIFLTSESALSKAALSPAEYFMRWSGLGMNAVFWFFVAVSYIVSAIYVARPPPTPPSGKDEGDNAEAFDRWRRRYLVDLIRRIAVMAWCTSVLPVIIFVFGLVAMAWQFQWLTLVETVVITVIAGHLLWPADDFAGLFLRLKGGDAAAAHAATVEVPTRVHRITGTFMVVVLVAPFLYAILIMVAPKFWTLVTMALTTLALGTAVILASRMLAGSSDDAPGDLKKTLAGQRVAMLRRLAPLIGVIGILMYVTSLGTSVVHNGYGWYKACGGYEETPECSGREGGFAAYVDSTARWTALRDRSVEALAAKKEPVGDACNVATRKLAATQALYGPILYSDTRSDGNVLDLCKEVELHRELLTMPGDRGKYPFVEIAKQCATKKAECGWWFKG